MLALLDWTLTALHVAVILAFMFLWIPRSTVRLHRWVVLTTAVSWLGLGLWKGLGYCFLTDLAWRVKHARGQVHLPNSFIKYAGDWLTGQDLPPRAVDTVAALVFLAGSGAAAFRWVEERRGRRQRA